MGEYSEFVDRASELEKQSLEARLEKIEKRLKDAETANARILAMLQSVAKDVTFTVSFSGGDGATGTTAALTLEGLGSGTLTANGFAKTGHDFAGWNTAADGTGTAFAAGATVSYADFASVSGNVTLYAQWTPCVYTITYAGTDGWTNPNPTTYTYGVGVPTLAACTGGPANKSWSGWTIGGNAATSISTTQTGNLTVTAVTADVSSFRSFGSQGYAAGQISVPNPHLPLVFSTDLTADDISSVKVVFHEIEKTFEDPAFETVEGGVSIMAGSFIGYFTDETPEVDDTLVIYVNGETVGCTATYVND